MNRWYQMAGVGAAVLLAAGVAFGQQAGGGQGRPFAVSNSLHVEFDDNIDQTKENKVESWKISDQFSISYGQVIENSYIGLRYTGIATWWDKRDDDITLDHVVDAEANLRLDRRFSIGVVEKFIRRDSPELVNADGTVNLQDSSYDYNSLNVSLQGRGQTTQVTVGGRWQFVRYEEDALADREDYDALSAGVTLSSQTTRDTALLLEVRGEQYDYAGAGKVSAGALSLPGLTAAPGDDVNTIPDRGFKSLVAGVGIEQKFSPNLSGRATVGYMMKDLDAANASDDSAPYAEALLTVTPSPDTSITLAGGYSLYQSGILTYASQERTSASLSVGHDLTSRLALRVGGSYINSDYKASNSVDTVAETSVSDGSEDIWVFSTRLVYRLDPSRRHSIEAGWSHTTLSSDLREEFDRNRYDAAWRIQL